jgi:hypothetical protein
MARLFMTGDKTMTDQNDGRVFDNQTLIERLKALREEVESAGDITRMLAPFPVLLAKVCETLDLSQDEWEKVLGPAANFVRDWRKGGKPD